MAAAEARAAWQRTANRCLVQEDVKRAPKLGCCPSSTSTKQYDSSNVNDTNGKEHPAMSFVPLNWNSMNSSLPPDTRWWLQLQPNIGCHKVFSSEQLSVSDDEPEERRLESELPTSMLSRGRLDNKNDDFETPCMVSKAFMKKDSETRVDEIKRVNNISQHPFKHKLDIGDYLFEEGEFMDWKSGDRLISKKTEKRSPGLDLPCKGGSKSEPWWRISNQGELASLVAQKSLEHIENCDLPMPTQTVHVSGDPFASFESLDGYKILTSSFDCKLQSSISDLTDHTHQTSISMSMDEKVWSSIDSSPFHSDTNKLFSADRSYESTANDPPGNKLHSESNSGRAQLLEALLHSQTRAREAEIVAQKACDEKEHVVKLLFRQASLLFAYKQWLQLLQLESLCLQLGIKEHQISTLFPALPWMPLNRDNAWSKGKRKRKKCSFWRYAVAFAVGLGLVGAGLLLGWTLGWLLPHL